MKKTIYTLIALFVFTGSIFSQSCHTSGSSICTVSGTMAQPGLSPRSDSLAPVDNGIANSTIIQFKNYNTAVYNGITVTVQQLKIDSINNLPNGLCWSTNKANDTYANQESGCIKVSGTPCANPGVYKLVIKVTVTVPFLGNIAVDAASVGLKYFVRVKNYGDAEVALDTLQTVAFAKPAGYSATQNCSPVICVPFTFTQSSVGNTSCATPIGSVTVGASGGTAPYTYTLGTSSNSTGTFTGLSGGSYTVTATDVNACTGTVSVSVSSTVPIVTVSSTAITAQTSCTINNGALAISASGGGVPYSFSDGTSTNATGAFAPLAAGSYTITATDNNQCSGSASFTVADSVPVVSVAVDTTTPQTACVGTNGGVAVTATGGTAAYSYTNGTSTNATGVFTGLASGAYTITATDAAGCVGTFSGSITASLPTVTVSVTAVNATSATATDGSATAVAGGGATPYAYLWNNTTATATASGLAAATYTVTATDANGCSASGTVSVSFNSGINNLGKEIISMNIFPNPAVEKITVDARFVSAKNVTVEIFNLLGEKMQSKNLGLTEKISETFSVKGLAKGTYFVKINAGEKLAAYPIVIE